MELRPTEVPIHFIKDPEGSLSKMKRRGCSSLARGWMNLVPCASTASTSSDKPGDGCLVRLIFMVPRGLWPAVCGRVSISLNTMLLAMAARHRLSHAVFGDIAAILFDYSARGANGWNGCCPIIRRRGTDEAAADGRRRANSAAAFRHYCGERLRPAEPGVRDHWAGDGLWLIMRPSRHFIFALMVRALGIGDAGPGGDSAVGEVANGRRQGHAGQKHESATVLRKARRTKDFKPPDFAARAAQPEDLWPSAIRRSARKT